VNSLASLIEGGVAFDTVVSGGSAVAPGAQFTIFESKEQASDDAISGEATGDNVLASVVFDGSLAGLAVGSEVRFKGLLVGRVAGITPIVDSRATSSAACGRSLLAAVFYRASFWLIL